MAKNSENPRRVTTLVSAVRACSEHKAPRCVRDAVHFTVSRVCEKHFLPCQAKRTLKMVNGKYYKLFLEIMASIPEIKRDDKYISRELLHSQGRDPSLAHCKAYYLIDTHKAGENTIVKRSLKTCVVTLSFSTLRKFASFGCFDSESVNLTNLFCELLFFPRVDFDDLLFVCGSAHSAISVSDRLVAATAGFRSVVAGDGRTYAPFTGLKKVFRQQMSFESEVSDGRVVAVDAHAMHAAILASRFSCGSERERLIEMLQTGKFYREFARLAACRSPEFRNLSERDVKINFLANVLFRFRPRAVIWRAFVALFPFTARKLTNFRDSRDWIVKRLPKVFETRAGKIPYRSKTRIGQFRLSRFFCRIEGEIFRGAQKRLFKSGVLTAPLHDSLLTAAKWADETKLAVEREIKRVLGFSLPVAFE